MSLRIALVATALITLAGCAGSASVSVVPLNFQRISPTGPLIYEFAPKECYYWVSDAKELCIAMTVEKKFLRPGVNQEEFHLSLVLEGLPAGDARTYPFNTRTVRARNRQGLSNTRFASIDGVAAVWDFGEDELHGRFEFRGLQQSYMVLMGWAYTKQVLCFGEFSARLNREKGEAILMKTEKDAMRRGSADERNEGKAKPAE